MIPDWVRHASDGGFVQADWEFPEDWQLDPVLRERQAMSRWCATRKRWLDNHPDVGELLLQQLRDRVAAKRECRGTI